MLPPGSRVVGLRQVHGMPYGSQRARSSMVAKHRKGITIRGTPSPGPTRNSTATNADGRSQINEFPGQWGNGHPERIQPAAVSVEYPAAIHAASITGCSPAWAASSRPRPIIMISSTLLYQRATDDHEHPANLNPKMRTDPGQPAGSGRYRLRLRNRRLRRRLLSGPERQVRRVMGAIVGSSLVSSAYVRPSSSVFRSMRRCRSRT